VARHQPGPDAGTPINNTFVNDRPGNATAIAVGGGVSSPAVVANDIVVGTTTFASQAAAQRVGNCQVGSARGGPSAPAA
jgi:hypothetical protein